MGKSHEAAAARNDADLVLSKDFPVWSSSPLREQVLRAGWREIHLPTLFSTAAYDAWVSANATGKIMTMREFATSPYDEANLPDRRNKRQLTRWLNLCEDVLAPVMRGE